MARHRLARVPYVGVSRAVVQAHVQRRQQLRQQRGDAGAWVYDAQDIYLDVARFQAGGGGMWAAA